ncbi:unnamed protein product, partial [Mesorhabditis spiculigera]
MFDRKRPQGFQKSFYGTEDSPRVAHKEYLDFSQIDSILPASVKKQQTRPEISRERLEYYNEEHHTIYRGDRNAQKSEDQGSFDSEETASTHMSKESLEEQPKPQLVGIVPMFDRKRPQGFQKSFYGTEDSPRVAHKEYLDFSQIDPILPASVKKQQTRPEISRERLEYYNEEHHTMYRGDRNAQKSEDQGSFDSEETASTHMSKESLEEQPKPQLVGIGVVADRPFSGGRRSFGNSGPGWNGEAQSPQLSPRQYEPVREIYRENNVSYDKHI